MPEGGKIVAFRGIPTTIDNERVAGFEAAIEGSGIEIVDMEHDNWNRDDSFTVMQDFLSKHPQLDAVWASEDDMAIGVLAAIEAAGRDRAGVRVLRDRLGSGDAGQRAGILLPRQPVLISV